MDLENVADRLDRMEQKIDKMADMMISLARTEEKLYSLEADRANLVDRINRHSEKLDALNDEVKENSRVTSNIVKLTWIIIGAIAVAFVKMFFMP